MSLFSERLHLLATFCILTTPLVAITVAVERVIFTRMVWRYLPLRIRMHPNWQRASFRVWPRTRRLPLMMIDYILTDYPISFRLIYKVSMMKPVWRKKRQLPAKIVPHYQMSGIDIFQKHRCMFIILWKVMEWFPVRRAGRSNFFRKKLLVSVILD